MERGENHSISSINPSTHSLYHPTTRVPRGLSVSRISGRAADYRSWAFAEDTRENVGDVDLLFVFLVSLKWVTSPEIRLGSVWQVAEFKCHGPTKTAVHAKLPSINAHRRGGLDNGGKIHDGQFGPVSRPSSRTQFITAKPNFLGRV